jgi:hypothetical protein
MINKESLNNLGFEYTQCLNNPEWEIAEKGCVFIQRNEFYEGWFLCVEISHDYRKKSKTLTLEDIKILDKILNG